MAELPSFNPVGEFASCMLIAAPLDNNCRLIVGAPVYVTSGYSKISNKVERDEGKDYSAPGASGALVGPAFKGPVIDKWHNLTGEFLLNDMGFKALTTGNPTHLDAGGNVIGYAERVGRGRSLCNFGARPRISLAVITFAGDEDGGCVTSAEEVWSLVVDGTGGTFTGTVDGFALGARSATIAHGALQTAVRALDASLADVEITGGPGDAGGTTPYVWTFPDGLVHNIVIDDALVTGGATTAVITRESGPTGVSNCKGEFYPNVSDWFWDRGDMENGRRSHTFTARAYSNPSAGHGVLNLHTVGIDMQSPVDELFLDCSLLPVPDLGHTIPHPAIAA